MEDKDDENNNNDNRPPPESNEDPVAGADDNKLNSEFFNSHKAGLDGLDKEKINKIIQEASKGSNFYSFQQKRQRRIEQQIDVFKEKLKSLKPEERQAAQRRADACAAELELTERILNRIIVHFDMDMFFAAVEIKDNPSLADKPMAVGSLSMISTSNYVARKFGVRSAMAGFIAKRLCPKLVLIKPNFSRYSEESKVVMGILTEYDQNLRAFSLDEVHLDLTSYVFEQYAREREGVTIEQLSALTELPDDLWEFAAQCVERIRQRVFELTKLTISAGISCNTLLAKISTDINKPNGQFMVKGHRDEIIEFVSNIEIRKFGGIGPVRSQTLHGLDITTGRQMFDERGLLFSLFSESSAIYFLRISLGIGSAFLDGEESPQKSHSRERTVGEICDQNSIGELLTWLAQRLAHDLQSNEQLCRTITLKLKKVSFEVFLKSKTIATYVDDAETIGQTGKMLLAQEMSKSPNERYRLVGLKVSNLKEKSELVVEGNQLTLPQILKNMPTTTKPSNRTSENMKCPHCGLGFEAINLFDRHQLFCDADDSDNEPQHAKSKGKTLPKEPRRNPVATSLRASTSVAEDASATTTSLTDNGIQYLICPICHLNNVFRDNAHLNEHIDTCLNRQLCIDLTKVPSSSSSGDVTRCQVAGNTTTTTTQSPKKGGTKKNKKQKVSHQPAQNSIERYFH